LDFRVAFGWDACSRLDVVSKAPASTKHRVELGNRAKFERLDTLVYRSNLCTESKQRTTISTDYMDWEKEKSVKISAICG
jgi:hypothetical protein